MTRKNVLTYLAALALMFAFGCGAALLLRLWDAHEANIMPLAGGQLLDLSALGITLRAPEGATLTDYTQDNLAYGGQARFAGSLDEGQDALRIFIYDNAQGDDIAAYSAQELVTYYMGAGASDVRVREIAGRPFVCYRAQAAGEDGVTQAFDTYETWSPGRYIVFETQMASGDVLPILTTLTFTD